MFNVFDISPLLTNNSFVLANVMLTVESSMKPVFGVPLEEHLRVTGLKVAFPIELCVCALNELGMDEEGLFRVAGGKWIIAGNCYFYFVVFIYSCSGQITIC